MSSCSLIVFQGDEQTEYDFLNSWGGAARIWTSLFDRYVPKRHEYDSWLSASCNPKDTRLWDLVKQPDIPLPYRAVFASTFDYAIVYRKDFPQFAADLREFVKVFPTTGIDHLEAWADVVDTCEGDKIGFVGTSVSGSLWSIPVEMCDYDRPYEFDADTEHFDVYEYVNSLERANVPV